ncbi:hypothetical protein FF38_11112 [Lucilia cuprina]|uniref:Uncharacterized protein n=1 Tax=Lucilia cuprina TaxID=7375 RepID=A0A0L0CRM4_LUCCU|nr:hypothetical protein FF38_11112 [Lucilia cuprina]
MYYDKKLDKIIGLKDYVIEGLQSIGRKHVHFVSDQGRRYNVFFENYVVSWKDIEYFYDIDSNLEIRRDCGNANSVTSTMFSCLFQKRWGLNFVNLLKEGNCEIHDDDESFPTISNSSRSIQEIIATKVYNEWEEFQSLPRPDNSCENVLPDDNLNSSIFLGYLNLI